jgi:hypothetical protein
MKTLKAIYLLVVLVVIVLPFASCNGGVDIFGTKVEVVQSRNPDGTIKAVNEVKNAAGESPDAHANIYHYPSGGIGVSIWYGDTPLAGSAPKLKR